MSELSKKTHSHLQQRLRETEARTRKVLESTPDDHPVVEPTRELLAIHREIRSLIHDMLPSSAASVNAPENPAVESAAIEIAKEEHTMKPEVLDVIKALFMWKDDPEERAKGAS